MSRRSLFLGLVLFSLGSSSWALKTERLLTAQAAVSSKGAKATVSLEVVSQRLLVRFAPGMTAPAQNALLAGQGATAVGFLKRVGWTVVQLATGTPVSMGLSQFKSLPGVLAVSPDRAYRAVKVPDDPLYAEQTALSQIDMPAAWEFDTGGTNLVTIAMIDTGVQPGHPDLASKLVSSGTVFSQFFDPDNNGTQSPDPGPTAACEHGTRTSGVAAAASDNGVGVSGVSWGAQLISLRVFNANDCNTDCSGAGCVTDDVAVSKALDYAIFLQENFSPIVGRMVVNMSLGAAGASCSAGDGTDPGAVANSIAVSTAVGIPFAIAAGNCITGPCPEPIEMPANCAGTTPSSGVMPVGSVDSGDNLAYFTDVGPELAANGVVAPGVNVETTDLNSGYTGSASGTSFSAPHVAGLMALILSAKPGASPGQVQSYIRGGAQNIGLSANQQGAGRINGFRTMKLAVEGSLANFAGDAKAIAFPNPFRPSQAGAVTITVPAGLQGGSTTVKIYNVAGEFVRQLSGLTWDGTNNGGNPVASGTYIFEVSTSQGHITGRLALIR